jgi:hypothetical protein
MNKTSILVSLLAALALAGGLFAWLGGGAAPPPAPLADEPLGPGADVDPTAEVEAWQAEAELVDAGFDADTEQPERSEFVLTADVAPRLVLQVWDRKRGEVAPEADVFVLEGYEGPELRDPFAPHRCELAIEKGRRFKATTEGRVELPRLTKRALVAAQLPGAVGFRVLDQRHREREEITLRADESVTVRVVDGRGRPVANVPVGVQQRVVERVDAKRAFRDLEEMRQRIEQTKAQIGRDPARAQQLQGRMAWYERRLAEAQKTVARVKQAGEKRRSQAASRLAKGKQVNKKAAAEPLVDTHYEIKAQRRTDARGYAVFRHFQFERHRQEKWWPKKHRDRFDAVLMVPLSAPVREPFVGRPMPEEAIVLEMPPTGIVALRTVDRDGRPYTHPVRGSLRIQDGRNPAWTRVPLRKEQDEREIVFEHVGLGMQFLADCRLDDDDFRWRSPVFAGPERAGERKTIDLVVAPGAAMLYGRVLDEAGLALGGREMTFLINSARGRLEGEEVLLDDEGRFHLPYNVRGSHQAPFRFQVRQEEHLQVPGLARTLPALPAEGITDVGDLQIGVLDRIAFGRIVNDLGEPIAGAHVQLQRERPSGRNGERLRFQDEAFTDAHSDEHGDFHVFGDVEAARYRLRLRADGHFPEETVSINPVHGTEVRMMRKARLVGTVTLPEWLPSRRVKVELRSLDDRSLDKNGQIADYRGKKYIHFDWVRPGLYSLSLRIQEFPEPFLRIDNLQVRPGDHDPHPRLRDLDLTRHLYRFEVFAFDDGGQRLNPKTPLLARITRTDGSSQFVGFSWRRGRAEIVNSQPTLEVRPVAPGFRAASRVLNAGRSEVRFSRVPPLSLHAPGMRSIIGSTNAWIGMRLVQALELASVDGRGGRSTRGFRRMSSSFGRLGADERAAVSPLTNGRYAIKAYLGDKGRGGLVEVELGAVDVEVVAGGPPVVVEVQPDAQRLQLAMQEVAQRQARAAANPGGK